ncbi:hypothetical protein G6F37_005433 [Rhizopus arrhizus]|nr:hypothetical protein G6F38_005589 [Rhizopus arrhizus]KAG1158836.1 hypothetical protein G6F37_005433 [Rhizopus arrhizus]
MSNWQWNDCKTGFGADMVPPASRSIRGTVTGHYLKCVAQTLNFTDQHHGMKEFYLIMDNAPIHTFEEAERIVASRSFRL